MRPLPIAGIVLILGGLFVIFLGVPYTSERQVMKVGDFEARVEEKRTVPAWLGIVAIVGGVVLLASAKRPPVGRGPEPRAPGRP